MKKRNVIALAGVALLSAGILAACSGGSKSSSSSSNMLLTTSLKCSTSFKILSRA